jgi:hypothetical protein
MFVIQPEKASLLYAIVAQGSMLSWWELQEDERSVTALEEEEAVAKCALLRAGATAEEKELAASALRKARTKSDELETKISTYDDTPWPLCRSVASLLIRMSENRARRGSEIEPF